MGRRVVTVKFVIGVRIQKSLDEVEIFLDWLIDIYSKIFFELG